MRLSSPPQLRPPAPLGNHRRTIELVALDKLLDRLPRLVELVASDLGISNEKGGGGGRPGMSPDRVLRAMLVRALEQCTFEHLDFILADSHAYRWFLRLGWSEPSPSRSTLHENIRSIKAETVEKINAELVGFTSKIQFEPGEKIRVDCTVTETSIHPPDDAWQLYDVVRVLCRLLWKASLFQPNISYHSRKKAAKRRQQETMVKDKNLRKKAYRHLLKITASVLDCAEKAVEALRTNTADDNRAMKLADEIAMFVERGQRVVDQTRKRVLLEESVPASSKVVSIFEAHTDIIIKCRRGVRYGHKLVLATGPTGLVVHCRVLKGNPADSTLVSSTTDAVTKATGNTPRQVAMDGGFASKSNLKALKERGVSEVCFSKRRGMAVSDMTSTKRVYRHLWRFRVGIEAGVSWLKRSFGLRRSPWRGEDGFGAYVQSSVLAFNLLLVALNAHY